MKKRTNIGMIPTSNVVGILRDLDQKSQSYNPHISWEGFTKFANMTRRQHLLFESGKNPFEQIPFVVLGEMEYGFPEEYYQRMFMTFQGVKSDIDYITIEHLRKLASLGGNEKKKALFVSIFCKDSGYSSSGWESYSLIREVIPGTIVTWEGKQYTIRECCEDMPLQCAYKWGSTLEVDDCYYVSGQTYLKNRGDTHEYERILKVSHSENEKLGKFIKSCYVGYSPFNKGKYSTPEDKLIFYLEPK